MPTSTAGSRPTARPIVGIVGNRHMINDVFAVHGGSEMNSEAVVDVSGAMPLIVPTSLDLVSVEELCETCAGFLLTGGRPNVHPEEYGRTPTPAHGTFDRERDRLSIALIRACIDRGQPILAVCRGFQEFNVALGGTLHPEIRDLPGRMNHRMPPEGSVEERFSSRHAVHFTEGGPFHRLMGSAEVVTNTAHGQGVEVPGRRFVIDGWAPDGTPEAAYVDGAEGFAMAVQWHPEFHAAQDPVSVKLFAAFGDALRAWCEGRKTPLRAIA